MKKSIITITILLFLNSCSFVNEKKIEEGNNIEVDNFIETQSKENQTSNNTEEEQEVQKTEEEIEKLIDLLLE